MYRLGLSMWLVGVGACVLTESSGDPSDSLSTAVSDTSDDGSAGSGSTGDPFPGVGSCVETPIVVGDANADGITGMSALELIAQVEGTYTGAISWSSEAPSNYLGPTAPSPMTMSITYDGGEIRSIDADLVTACEHDGPCPCDDSFEVDVTWHLASEDGVLDETWVAPVVHQPGSLYMAGAIGIRHEFQPDDTQGSLSAESFALEDGAELRKLDAQSELVDGAAQGSINIEMLWMGGAGYGAIASFAGVRAVDDAACNVIRGAAACVAAGCVEQEGQPIYGAAPDCDCAPVESYCFAAAAPQDGAATLYTRQVGDSYDVWDEVVALPQLADPPPPPWRACADAPEVAQCACFEAAPACG